MNFSTLRSWLSSPALLLIFHYLASLFLRFCKLHGSSTSWLFNQLFYQLSSLWQHRILSFHFCKQKENKKEISVSDFLITGGFGKFSVRNLGYLGFNPVLLVLDFLIYSIMANTRKASHAGSWYVSSRKYPYQKSIVLNNNFPFFGVHKSQIFWMNKWTSSRRVTLVDNAVHGWYMDG